MGIMDVFRNITGATPTGTPPAGPTPAPANANGNTTVPNANTPVPTGDGPAAIPAAGTGEKSPLENFSKLFENDPNAKPPASMVPTINADPAKLMEAAKKIDFTKAVNPEVLANAAKGDVAALTAAINEAAQAGFAQSAGTTAALVRQALEMQAKSFKEQVIPEILRDHAASQKLNDSNALFTNPAVAPVVDMVKSQLALKFPTAYPAELAKHAETYFSGMATEMAKAMGMQMVKPTATNASTPAGREPVDWGQYFGVADGQ